MLFIVTMALWSPGVRDWRWQTGSEISNIFLLRMSRGRCEIVMAATQSRSQRPRSFWLARSNSGSPRFTDFPSLCACSESSLTNLIGSGLNLLCLHSHSKSECHWAWPGVPMFPAHNKRDAWERGWAAAKATLFPGSTPLLRWRLGAENPIRSDEGQTLETSAFESLYRGQCTL